MKKHAVTQSASRRRAVYTSLILFTSLWACAVVFSQAQGQQPPVFKTRIDLRQLDVSVLDRDRRPVKGLTAADFTLTEDGVAQKIEAFSAVDLPDTVRSEPAWASSTKSDIVSNDLDSARVFVLVVDDAWGLGRIGPLGVSDPWAKREMAKSVRHFVDQLGPDDVAAVVFPGSGERSQIFTRDKAKLASAVDWYADVNDTVRQDNCNATPKTVLHVAHNLATMKNRRKVIVYFGGNLIFTTSPGAPCQLGILWSEVVQVANANNISIYPVDTMGLRPKSQAYADVYMSLAEHAGGHALINSNGFEEGLTRIFTENTSYYLLAYQPTKAEADGRFRRVVVKVNRKDVEVTSVRSYWAPKPASADKPAPPAPPPDLEALADVLPLSQIPLRATAAAFRGEDGGGVVSVAVGLAQPAFPSRTRESVDMLVRIFTPDGIDYGTERQLVPVVVPASPASDETAQSRYEVLARIEVPGPGKYELRMSLHSHTTDRRGSVYVDVDVPDFTREKLALSGVVVNAFPGFPAAPARIVAGVTPVTPTTLRSFATGDLVTTFFRIYQGGNASISPVELKTQIRNEAGAAVFETSETLGPDRFSAGRAADVQFRLPLAKLTAGEYLATFEASVGKLTIKRDVRFQVR